MGQLLKSDEFIVNRIKDDVGYTYKSTIGDIIRAVEANIELGVQYTDDIDVVLADKTKFTTNDAAYINVTKFTFHKDLFGEFDTLDENDTLKIINDTDLTTATYKVVSVAFVSTDRVEVEVTFVDSPSGNTSSFTVNDNCTFRELVSGGGGGGSQVIVRDTAPSPGGENLEEGTLWWDSTEGDLFVLYSDNGNLIWVDATNHGGGGSGGAEVIVSPEIPSPDGLPEGTLWWDSKEGDLFVLYEDPTEDGNDVNGLVWVDATNHGNRTENKIIYHSGDLGHPEGQFHGQIWVDTNCPPALYIFNDDCANEGTPGWEVISGGGGGGGGANITQTDVEIISSSGKFIVGDTLQAVGGVGFWSLWDH